MKHLLGHLTVLLIPLTLVAGQGCIPHTSSETVESTDQDGDGYAPDDGDCDDHDPDVRPGIREICDNGIDDNCNGYVDGEEPDRDGDGYGICDGDCNDDNPMVGPYAFEVPDDDIDNDCDGEVDEAEPLLTGGGDCLRDGNGVLKSLQPWEAMDMDSRFVVEATMLYARSYDVIYYYDESGHTADASGWGALKPRVPIHDEDMLAECAFVVLSTGVPLNPAPQDDVDKMNLGYRCDHDPVQDVSTPDAWDKPHQCYDLTQFKLVPRTPQNANSLSFDFLYLSSEYPEWIGSDYNDTFYAMFREVGTESDDATKNVSFDARGRAISVNNDFFEAPSMLSVDITGTGYDTDTGDGTPVGSTTGWIRTTVPVTPGSTVELVFSIHDEGDQLMDSAVVLDHLRWGVEEVQEPVTVQ